MSDNPSYETAPLKTEYILDLDNFNEGMDEAEDRLKSFKEIVEDIAIKLNIVSNISEIKEDLDNLEHNKTIKVDIESNNGGSINPINSDDIEKIDSLNELLAKTIDIEEEIKDTSNEMFDGLKDGLSDDSLSGFDDSLKATNEYLSDLSKSVDDIDDRFETLKDLANIQGNVDIEGLQGTIAELAELQNKLSDVSSDLIELNETSNISDDELGRFQDRISDSSFEMNQFQGHLDDTVEGFNDSVAPMRESSEGIHEYGENMMESGQMTLYTGMMIASIMRPIGEVGEASFKLGLTSSTAMQIASHAFGSNSKAVEDWSNQATKNLGITTGAALQSAEKFGFATRTMGANASQSAKLGENYTDLAAHIMLMSNGTMNFSQAQQMAMAVMKGQTFQTKALGLTFTSTALRAEELKLGFTGTFKSLTPLQQATVRYHVAQNELNKAYGTTSSLLKTSNGKWLIAKATLESTGEVIGERLLPFVLKCATGLEHLATWFDHLSKSGQDFIIIAGAVALAIGPIVMGIGLLTLGIGGIATAIGVAKDAFEIFDAVLLANPIILIITGIIAACALLYEAWHHNWFGIRTITEEVFKDIGDFFEKFKGQITAGALVLLSVINPFIGLPLLLTDAWQNNFMNIQGLTKKFILDIESYYEEFKNYCVEKWQNIVTDTTKFLNIIGNRIKSNFERYKNNIKSSLENIGSDISSGFDKFVSYVSTGLHNIFSAMVTLIENSPVLDSTAKLAESIIHLVETLATSSVRIVGALLRMIGRIVMSGLDDVLHITDSVGNSIFNAAQQVWNEISDTTKEIWDDISNFMTTIWKDINNTFANILSSIEAFCSSTWNNISNITMDIWNHLSNFFSAIWSDIKGISTSSLDAIANISNSVWNSVRNLTISIWNSISNFFGNVWSDIENTANESISAVKSVVISGWDSIMGWLQSVIMEPIHIVLNLGSAMESAGANLISSMLCGAEGEWGRFTGWLTSSINRISNWVSSETSHLVGELNGADGSHATGLSYVPWDGYRAELHRGEMVLTAEQAQQFKAGNTNNSNITINAPSGDANDIAYTVKKTLNNMTNGFI